MSQKINGESIDQVVSSRLKKSEVDYVIDKAEAEGRSFSSALRRIIQEHKENASK
jgi:hypothetical protein